MSWEAIGALGSIIGAIAVFLSLIYLAIQVRQNTQSLEDSKRVTSALTIQERSKMFISTHQLIQESPYMAPILAKVEGAEDLDGAVAALSPEERIRLRSLAMEALIKLETQIHLYSEDMLDERYFAFNTKASIRLRYPLWKALGILDQFNVRPETRELIEGIVAEDDGTA